MVKVDYDRDYYADLDLPSTAEPDEIRKQFKKLALKFHPDRNRGNEDSAKEQFVLIQSAQEVLLDSLKKAKYDAEYKRRHGPSSGGFKKKGNPWSDVTDRYPRPPQRAPNRPAVPTRAATSAAASGATSGTSGASRYSNWGPPTSSYRNTRGNADDNVRAWEHMRSDPNNRRAQTRQNTAASAGSTTPRAKQPEAASTPRNNFQRQKAEASFGTRRTGFMPHSPMGDPMGDEPPVSNKYYTTTKTHTNLFAGASDDESNSKDADPMFRDSMKRERMPYASHAGERTNLFEGVGRATSVRESPRFRKEEAATTADAADAQFRRASYGGNQPARSASERKAQQSNSRADNPSFMFTAPDERPQQQGQPAASYQTTPNTRSSTFASKASTSSADSSKATAGGDDDKAQGPSVFPIDNTKFPPAPSGIPRGSTENINTHFASGDESEKDYHFNAGNRPQDDTFSAAKRNHRAKMMRNRRSASPLKTATNASPGPAGPIPAPTASTPGENRFNPEQWSEFGPHNFVPPRQSASPTRPPRNLKKAKAGGNVKMTTGTAGLVEEEDSTSGEERSRFPATPVPDAAQSAPSPNAMDIDSPPPEPQQPESSSARNIPVEPSRPEWRAGNVNGTPVKPKIDEGTTKPAPKPKATTVAGSEDSEEFRLPKDAFANFGEALKVGPFGPSVPGLSSLGDLKGSLPFPSQAAARVHLGEEGSEGRTGRQPALPMVPPPVPNPPAALQASLRPSKQVWERYVTAFETYMWQWGDYSTRSSGFFSDRAARREQQRKAQGLRWLGAVGPTQMREYLAGLEEEGVARQRWVAACAEHERAVREFAKFRDAMSMQH